MSDVTSGAMPARNYRDRIDLSGRILMVCGAGQGLGLEAARALADCGGTVICVDREADRVSAAAETVGGLPLACDVTNRAEVERAISTVEAQYQRLDGVVDIIGGSQGDWVEDLKDETIAHEFNLNFTHAHLLVQLASPAIARSGGGTITFVGSIAGLSSLPRQAIYGSAKAALHHFIRYSAVELGHQGIRVNGVAPGYVRTPRMMHRFSQNTWAQLADAAPLGRVGEPEDVAGPLLFLTSDLSRFVTGQILVADGGMLLPVRSAADTAQLQLRGRSPKSAE
jgi:NAD(P)-dependent dehydrogenase (short-subunit alcohol dehydrogenase family)